MQLAKDAAAKQCQPLFDALVAQGVTNAQGIVALTVDESKVALACKAAASSISQCANGEVAVPAVVTAVENARYNHLKDLLGDRLLDEDLLRIVRNQILIDIQGNDILYQIFTRCILQDQPDHEAPFLEFIQRVCDTPATASGAPSPTTRANSNNKQRKKKKKGIKPGCGGFGIRNFLTLFLSIEVAKALRMREEGQAEGDRLKENAGHAMFTALTKQLEESNPVLTSISDNMTSEEEMRAEMEELGESKSEQDVARQVVLAEEIKALMVAKEAGQAKLMQISERFKNELRSIRDQYNADLEGRARAGSEPAGTK